MIDDELDENGKSLYCIQEHLKSESELTKDLFSCCQASLMVALIIYFYFNIR